MKFAKPRELVREMRLRKNKGKVITSTVAQPQNQTSKSDHSLASNKVFQRLTTKKAKSSTDIPGRALEKENTNLNVNKLASTPEKHPTTFQVKKNDKTFLGKENRPHTPIIYEKKLTRLTTFTVRVLAPLERFLNKFKLYFFRRRKDVRINTDRNWYRKTSQFQESYKNAVASKTFIVKGHPKLSFPNPVPKVVLFSLRYPSPYPYIYHRIRYKYEKKKDDSDNKKKATGGKKMKEEKKTAGGKKSTEEKKTAEGKKSTEEKKTAEGKRSTEEKKTAEGKRSTEEKKTVEGKKMTEEKKTTKEKKKTE